MDIISLLEDGSDDLILLVYRDVDGSATSDKSSGSAQGANLDVSAPTQGEPVSAEAEILPPIVEPVEPQTVGWLVELNSGVINV